MLTPETAWQRLEPHLGPLPVEPVARGAALGRVLGATLRASCDLPPADVSALDGYAYRGELAPGSELPVALVVPAGTPPGARLPDGAAARIFTGAPVPDGADRVIGVEETVAAGKQVRLLHPVAAGNAIRRRAEALATGSELLARGTLLSPAALSLLASQGLATVPVHRPPRVAVLTTGDEVVPPSTVPGPGKVRDSHSDFLLASIARLGLAGRSLGIAPDDPDELARRMAEGLAADVLLTCGGVSMGESDFTESALAALGCQVLFDAVAIQPGKPLVAARRGAVLIFGLPGNPASVMVAWWLFVAPALRRLAGEQDGFWQFAELAELGGPIPGAKGRDRFLPATWELVAGRLRVAPREPRGSHDLPAFAGATALIRVPAKAAPRTPGELCEVLRLDR